MDGYKITFKAMYKKKRKDVLECMGELQSYK